MRGLKHLLHWMVNLKETLIVFVIIQYLSSVSIGSTK